MKYIYNTARCFVFSLLVILLLLGCDDKEEDPAVIQDNGEMNISVNNQTHRTTKVLAVYSSGSEVLSITGYFDDIGATLGIQVTGEMSNWEDGASFNDTFSFDSFAGYTYISEPDDFSGVASTGLLDILIDKESEMSYKGSFTFSATNTKASVDDIVNGDAEQLISGSYSDVMIEIIE